jgi:hypothetical protein
MMGIKMTLDLTFDGQVDADDLEAVAKQAVVALNDVYKVVATFDDGSTSTAWAEAGFDNEGDKVVTGHGGTR